MVSHRQSAPRKTWTRHQKYLKNNHKHVHVRTCTCKLMKTEEWRVTLMLHFPHDNRVFIPDLNHEWTWASNTGSGTCIPHTYRTCKRSIPSQAAHRRVQTTRNWSHFPRSYLTVENHSRQQIHHVHKINLRAYVMWTKSTVRYRQLERLSACRARSSVPTQPTGVENMRRSHPEQTRRALAYTNCTCACVHVDVNIQQK